MTIELVTTDTRAACDRSVTVVVPEEQAPATPAATAGEVDDTAVPGGRAPTVVPGEASPPSLGRTLRSWLVAAALLVAAAFVLLPVRFGGAAAFVAVHGTSMEPTYHAGDLLYARRQSGYRPGDVAIYRAAQGLVVHRVQERLPDGHYVLKGDNQPHDDGVHPDPAAMVAKVVVNLGPLPLRLLAATPMLMALVCAAAVGWYLWPVADAPAERAAGEGSGDEDSADANTGGSAGDRGPTGRLARRSRRAIVTLCALGASGALVGGLFLWQQASGRVSARTAPSVPWAPYNGTLSWRAYFEPTPSWSPLPPAPGRDAVDDATPSLATWGRSVPGNGGDDVPETVVTWAVVVAGSGAGTEPATVPTWARAGGGDAR